MALELAMPARRRVRRYALVFLLTACEGLFAALLFVRTPSMERNAFLFGLSSSRLLLGGLALGVVAILAGIGVSAAIPSRLWLRHQTVLNQLLSTRRGIAIALTLLWVGFVAAATAAVLSAPSIVRSLGNLQPILIRALPLTLWALLSTIQVGVLLVSEYRDAVALSDRSRRWQASSIGSATLLGVWCVVWYVVMYSGLHWEVYPFQMLAPLLTAAMIAILGVSVFHSLQPDSVVARRLRIPGEAVAVFLAVLLVMLASAMAVNRYRTPDYAYFPQLAEAFLDGRAYLVDPPITHDMTPYDGRWYVTHPPLVALLLIPWVAVSGAASVNTVVFSAVFSSATGALVFLVLEQLSAQGLTRLGPASNLLLTGFFSLGTVHWWVGIAGDVWFLSQVVPLTFVALAVLITLRRGSGLLAGASLGVALLGRPNLVLLLPFLAGIRWQLLGTQSRQSATRRTLLSWIVSALIPLGLAVALLLAYNCIRFNDAMDFGYKTENVGAWRSADLNTYGQFNLIYASRNLSVMIAGLPVIDPSCSRLIAPTNEGMSIFLTMPILVFLGRSFRRIPWVVGAWVSIGLSLVPLILYYNTGAWQFGYRFFLDILIPVVCLLALAAGRRMSVAMRVSIGAGIAINLAGLLWWFGAWC
jgi:hypothetical protein